MNEKPTSLTADFALDRLAHAQSARVPNRTIDPRGSFPWTLAMVGAITILALFGWGPNFSLALAAMIVLVLGAWICWRPGEPAVILTLFVYQWVQASIAIFVANLHGVTINETAQLSRASMGEATFLSLVGLLAVVGAFRLAAGRPQAAVIQRAGEGAMRLSVNRLLIAYAVTSIGAIAVSFVATISEGIRQPILALLSFKEAMFIIIAYVGFKRGGQFRKLFYAVFAIEFISSLGGYFSSFQTLFIFSVIALLAARVRLRAGQIFGVSAFAVVAIFFGVVWSAVKDDYRNYLNEGTGQQTVNVEFVDAVRTLADISLSLDSAQLADGADRLLMRLTYVEFFGATLNHVPAVVDHTHGKLWGEAVVHPFTPRLFFPNKPITDSSALTNTYSGVRVAGWDSGTQISIGYIGESYIDFGAWGMFFPLVLYGFATGFLYRRVLLLRKFAGLLSMGLCVPLLMGGSYLNAETIKMVGNLSVTALVIFASHAVAGVKIRRLLLGADKSRRPRHRSQGHAPYHAGTTARD